MSFRLKSRGSVTEQLHELVAEEFRKALKALARPKPEEEAVHEARKSVKKIRAVIRLLHVDLGSDYRTENERLRAVTHRLSSLRDVDATTETLRALHEKYPDVIGPALARTVERELRTLKEQARAESDRLTVLAANELREAQKSTTDRIGRVRGIRGVRKGITRGYRRARQAMKGLNKESNDAQFHLWRRRVKDHWYQMRLLAGRGSKARLRVRRVEKLEDWLGDDHDLVILHATLLGAPNRFGDARTTEVVGACIKSYQRQLRKRALKLGPLLFIEKPRQFGKSITT